MIDFARPACQSGRLVQLVPGVMSSALKLTFVIGGARSGKSRYAEGLIAALVGRRIVERGVEKSEHQKSSPDLLSARARTKRHPPFRSSTGTPRPVFVASTRPTAGLLARGSAPCPAFPAARAPPVAIPDKTTRSQLRGQLRILPAHALKASPHSLFRLLTKDRRLQYLTATGQDLSTARGDCAHQPEIRISDSV